MWRSCGEKALAPRNRDAGNSDDMIASNLAGVKYFNNQSRRDNMPTVAASERRADWRAINYLMRQRDQQNSGA